MAFISKVDNLNNNISPLKKDNGVKSKVDFEEVLKEELEETNNSLKEAEKLEADIATGKVEDLATATITIQKAEMQMKMMLEVRNKAINAYKDLLKTQI